MKIHNRKLRLVKWGEVKKADEKLWQCLGYRVDGCHSGQKDDESFAKDDKEIVYHCDICEYDIC